MTEALILPTTRDEAWRYSDVAALEGMDLSTFDDWRDIEVPAGETFRDVIAITDENTGPDETVLHRLRVRLGEGARCCSPSGELE